MWPFNKNKSKEEQPSGISTFSYSQLDLTENFDDHLRLGPEDWIKTTPLNQRVTEPEASGLPSKNATPEAIYETASKLSAIREEVNIPNDGVYCPICHIANTQINKLHLECPKCGRTLLKFGWD